MGPVFLIPIVVDYCLLLELIKTFQESTLHKRMWICSDNVSGRYRYRPILKAAISVQYWKGKSCIRTSPSIIYLHLKTKVIKPTSIITNNYSLKPLHIRIEYSNKQFIYQIKDKEADTVLLNHCLVSKSCL